MRKTKTDSIFANRNFLTFWLARTASRVGDNFALVAIAIYAASLPNSANAMSILLISQLLPQLMSPIFGSFVDRKDPKTIMVMCDFARAFIFILMFLTNMNIATASFLIFLSSFFSNIFNPASRTVIPALLDKDKIVKGNAALSTGANAGMAIGPIIAGFLAGKMNFNFLFLVNSVSFLISGLFIYYIKFNFSKIESYNKSNILEDIVKSMKYIEFKFVAFNLFIVAFFGSICHASLIFYNNEYLKGNPYTFGLLTSSYGIGMILLPMVITLLPKEYKPLTLILSAIILLSISTSLMAIIPVISLSVIMRFFMGAGNGILNIGNDSFVQLNVKKSDIGKVFGSIFFFPALASIIALIINPLLLERYKASDIYLLSGILTITALLPLLLWNNKFVKQDSFIS